MATPKRRIMLLDVPRLLGDRVRGAVAARHDLEVIGHVTAAEAGTAIAESTPDCVIVGDRATPPPACSGAFETQPHLVVLALAGTGADGTLWEPAPHRVPLGALSRDGLISALSDVRVWRWDG